MDSEKLLPNDQRLNTYFDEYGDEVRYEIDEVQRLQDGNLLSVDLEFHSYEVLKNIASIAYALEKRVIKQGDMQVFEAMYRGVLFSYQAAGIVYGESLSFDAGRYLRTIADEDDGYETLVKDVHLYLGANPAVGELLEYYIDELDEGRNYHHAVELAGGMIFMLSERALAERFIREDASNCSMDELDEAS